MSETRTTSDAAAIIDITRLATEPQYIAERDDLVVLTNGDGQQEIHDLSTYDRFPRWQRRDVTVWDAESLINYVAKHGTDETTLELWADEEQRTIRAVFDGPSDGVAGRSDHTATLKLRTTPAWQAWNTFNGKMLGQVEFAELLEDNLPDIVKPIGAEMLELAQTFQAKSKVDFQSYEYLANGQRALKYTEITDAKAGARGQIEIPATFELGLAPFLGGSAYRVLARLRWRISDGGLRLGYKLDRPEETLRAAFTDVAEKIAEATPVRVNAGRP